MEIWEFYRLYANVPLPDRDKEIETLGGKYTLSEIYYQVHQLDEYLRPYQSHMESLIRIAEDSNLLQKPKQ